MIRRTFNRFHSERAGQLLSNELNSWIYFQGYSLPGPGILVATTRFTPLRELVATSPYRSNGLASLLLPSILFSERFYYASGETKRNLKRLLVFPISEATYSSFKKNELA